MRPRQKMIVKYGGFKTAAALWIAGRLLAAPALAEAAYGLHDYIKGNYVETLALIPALTLLGMLAVIVGIDAYIRPDLRRTMRVIIAMTFSLVAQNYIEYRLTASEFHWLGRTLSSIYGYVVRPAILALFLRLIAPKMRLGWAWALVGVNAAVNATALFSHLCFWIDASNRFHRGPLGRMCLYISAILLVCVFYMTMRVFKPHKRKETWLPVLVLGLIAGALVLDDNVGLTLQPVSYLTIAVVVSCVMYYIWMHLQFVREHEQALVAGQRVQLMLSQIKPHFLHNALAVIAELCDSDPETAKSATIMFSKYLRGNMNSIDETRAIPFERELGHTRIYLEIEKLRFEDALRMRYDIRCTGFTIPALTLQPLVENAVRHGVRENPGGRGTVTIASRETPEAFEVCVTDDGPGFDPAQPMDDGQPHVGLENVRERLAHVCGGVLTIRSAPGEGTTATIKLPKDRQEVRTC